MANYLVTYTGGATPETTTPEEREAIMKAWMAWFGHLGDAVVDMGAPTGASRVITPGGGTRDAGLSITGYSIIRAESLEAAADACRQHPHLDAGGSIIVSEALDVG